MLQNALLAFCTRPPMFIWDTGIQIYQIPGPTAETIVTDVLPAHRKLQSTEISDFLLPSLYEATSGSSSRVISV